MSAKLGRLQASLDDETRCVNEEKREREGPFLSKKFPKRQLLHRPDDTEKQRTYGINCVLLSLRGVGRRKLWRLCRVSCISFELPSIVIVGVYQTLPSLWEWTTRKALEAFFEFLQKARMLIKKQRDTFLLTVKTDLETLNALFVVKISIIFLQGHLLASQKLNELYFLFYFVPLWCFLCCWQCVFVLGLYITLFSVEKTTFSS